MSDEEIRELLRKVIKHCGSGLQVFKTFEEMAELQKELVKCETGQAVAATGQPNFDNIAEEIADVEIMLEQMKLLYDIEENVVRWRHAKLYRLKARLEAGRL